VFKVSMTARGQVLIPIDLRRKLHLAPGARFIVCDADGKIILVPELSDPVEAGLGLLTRQQDRQKEARP